MMSAHHDPRRAGTAERGALAGVTVLAFALDAWRLDVNGLGNQYYAAAARSMSQSWHAFFFASLDPGGFISVDKPPVAMWTSALAARLFGYGPWALLLPSALAGSGAVALLWVTVRRTGGPVAATVAALVLALSPINVAVDRLNLPEPFLVLSLVAAAWAVVRSFDAERSAGWGALAGLFVGIGFNTKMLAADVAVPALGLAILVGTRGRWWPRVRNGATFAVAALAASVPWMVALALTPAHARPWMGGSTDDSVADLVLGYNGLGRVDGTSAHGRAPSPVGRGIGGIVAGVPGPTRLFGPALAVQVTWLLPVAVAAALVAAWNHRRDRRGLGALVLWSGWFVVYGAVFSEARGIFHAYYTSVMVPALAAVIGLGAGATVERFRARPGGVALAGGAVASATVAWQAHLAGFVPGFFDWTSVASTGLVAGVAIVAIVMVVLDRPRAVRAAGALGAVAVAAVLVTPAAWATSEADHRPTNTTLPQAGPRRGLAGVSFGSVASDGDAPLARFLRRHHSAERWDLATANARQASGLIAYDHLSVMALGGFMGTDPTTGVEGVARMVGRGEVRYFAPAPLSSAESLRLLLATLDRRLGPLAPTAAGRDVLPVAHGGRTDAGKVMAAVIHACRPVTLPASVRRVPALGLDRVWDCRGRGDALRREGHHLALGHLRWERSQAARRRARAAVRRAAR